MKGGKSISSKIKIKISERQTLNESYRLLYLAKKRLKRGITK